MITFVDKIKHYIKRKPKCYGNYIFNIKCIRCDHMIKCLEVKNTKINGTIINYTDKPLPKPKKQ